MTESIKIGDEVYFCEHWEKDGIKKLKVTQYASSGRSLYLDNSAYAPPYSSFKSIYATPATYELTEAAAIENVLYRIDAQVASAEKRLLKLNSYWEDYKRKQIAANHQGVET